ncbi:hypothetical protein HCB01_14205, partial [Listeria seeligeri]|nr:hypothetical protein [Listeria seeligeri]
VSDDSNGVYDSAARTVTWEFDAPTINAQKAVASGESLFNKTIEVRTTYDTGITETTGYTNTASVSAVDYGNQTISKNASAKTYAGPAGDNVPVPDGAFFVPYHTGPSNGSGGLGDPDNRNPNPSVYDSALLRFDIYDPVFTANSSTIPFDKYEVTYNVDDNLNLNKIVVSRTDFNPDSLPPD